MDAAEINTDSEKSYFMEYDLCERSDCTVRFETSVNLYTKFLLALHRIKKEYSLSLILVLCKTRFSLVLL